MPCDESVNMEEQISRFKSKRYSLPVRDGSHCLWKDPPEVKAAVFKKTMERPFLPGLCLRARSIFLLNLHAFAGKRPILVGYVFLLAHRI